MYNWERRAAENLTNAEHMREVRRQIDLDYQHQLRRRERERAEAEVKREILGVRTPSPPSTRSNKFKTRTYDRPWAQGVAAAKKVSKPSPCSYGKSASSEQGTRCSWSKGTVSCLPAISNGTQSKTTELAMTSKTPHRKATLASNCNKEQSVQCRNKHRSVDVKGRVLKVSTHGKTNKQTQSQDILKGKNKMKHLWDRATISTRKDPVCTSILGRHSLPQPLISSPRHSDTHWPRLLRLHHPPSSPEDEPALQLISDPFEGFSETNSVTEELEDISSEDTNRDDFYTGSDDNTISSVAESIDSECLSSAGTRESSPSNSSVVLLSSLLPRLDVLSTESEEEEADDDLPASWQDTDRESYYIPVQWTGSQSSSVITSTACSLYSLQSLSSQLSTSEISNSASVTSDGYSLMPPLAQTWRANVPPLPPVTGRVNRGFVTSPQQIDQHLPELARRPSWLTSQTRLATPPRTSFSRRQSILVNRQQETGVIQEETHNNRTNDTLLSSGEASGPRTSGQMDHLTLELMTLHDILEELVHIQEHQAEEGGATAAQEDQTVTDSNPETIRRLKERLLEESSDEEDGDQCRICQSAASSLANPLLTPCQCSGSLQFIHHDCLKKWIQTKILSGSELSAVKTCELCKGSLTLDLDDFDLDDYYRTHGLQQQADDISTDLYMLLLLQQRFSDLLQATHSRTDTVSRIWTRPILPHILRMRASRAGQSSNPTPGTSDT